MNVSFTKLEPLPDPIHGVPSARSSHGLSCVTMNNNSKLCLVLLFGENVCRTPLSIDQAIWIAETTKISPQEGMEWKWRLVDTNTMNYNSSDRPFPVPRLAHSQASIGQDIYIFGGRVGVDMNETSLGDMWRFHVPTETWTPITCDAQEAPEARSFHKMVAIDKSLFLFGGCGASGKRLNDLYRFDTVESKWYKLENSFLLKGRGGPNLLALRNAHDDTYLAVVAGFIGEETKDGHVYLPQSALWANSTMQGLQNLRPRSVCVFGSFQKLNIGVIFGGEVDPSERGHEGAGGFTNDLVLLDGATETIMDTLSAPNSTSSTPWPEDRGWADGATFENGETNSLFFFGGLTGDDENPRRLDDLWVCNLHRSRSTNY